MRTLMLTLLAVLLLAPCRALAIDDAHKKKAEALIDKAIVYLRKQQDAKTGGWAVNPQGPAFPAITGLVVNGMLMQPGLGDGDASVKAGVAYMLKYRQPDGGIYDNVLPSYNTSIALSALARVNTPEAKAAIKSGQDFLRSLQFGEAAAITGPAAKETQKVDRSHPFYGGVGYDAFGGVGRGGRAKVGHEVAQGVVRFVADGADDGGGARRDRAAQRLVGERQQVLDAAATAGDDDHVDGGVAIQLAQCLDDLWNGIWALHDGVAHLEPGRGPAPAGDGHHVTLCGRGAAGDQPNDAGQERDRPLEPRIEQPFGVQQLAQPFDAGQQLADADRANLADPQRK